MALSRILPPALDIPIAANTVHGMKEIVDGTAKEHYLKNSPGVHPFWSISPV